MNTLSRYIKNFKWIFKNTALKSYECPMCATNKFYEGEDNFTARPRHIWDSQYKKYKFYVYCNCCGFHTPAFSTIQEAENHWAINWAQVEDSLISKNLD